MSSACTAAGFRLYHGEARDERGEVRDGLELFGLLLDVAAVLLDKPQPHPYPGAPPAPGPTAAASVRWFYYNLYKTSSIYPISMYRVSGGNNISFCSFKLLRPIYAKYTPPQCRHFGCKTR